MYNFDEYLRQGEPSKAEKHITRFLYNLLLKGDFSLKNREMHIHFTEPVNDTVKTKNNTVNDTVFSLIKQKHYSDTN